jgi:site-specific recombinase XerD
MTSPQILSQLSANTRTWFSSTVLDPYADGYFAFLLERGYTRSTAKYYLRSVAHFAHWSSSLVKAIGQLNEELIETFIEQHLPTCQCTARGARSKVNPRAALKHLLALLRLQEVVAPRATQIPAHLTAELKAFDQYLVDVRGLRVSTRQTQLIHTCALLRSLFSDTRVDLARVTVQNLGQFIERYTRNWKPASVRQVGNSLRSYFRFKTMQGVETTALNAAIPTIAQWRLSRLPRALSDAQLEQLLKAFNRRCANGRRDYAIARCYIDLGLRTAEVARLTLDDLDWRAGTIRIAAKSCRQDLLPLPAKTGQAIAAYLRSGRRRCNTRALFLRFRPPLDKPVSSETIRAVIRNAAVRCGLAQCLTGPHRLRHTLAQRLVRSGTSLKEIADVLRHRNLDTTTIYAKVDLEALSTVAGAWPGRSA